MVSWGDRYWEYWSYFQLEFWRIFGFIIDVDFNVCDGEKNVMQVRGRGGGAGNR